MKLNIVHLKSTLQYDRVKKSFENYLPYKTCICTSHVYTGNVKFHGQLLIKEDIGTLLSYM